jgi:2-hydroxychromene-2-carboxylate isomerase
LPVRWPDPFPADTALAMRAAIFAQASGRAVAFSLAAFRQAFAAGRDLGDPDNVVIAAAACELHPRAVLKGIDTRSVRERLEAACVQAAAAGVRSLPAVRAGTEILEGADAVERAAALLSGLPASP